MQIQFRGCGNVTARRQLRWAISVLVLGFLTLPSALLAQSARVSALGRLEPWQGTLRITAPSTPESTGASVLGKLLVDRGDSVQVGQLLAVTEANGLLQAQVEQMRAAREHQRRQAIAEKSAATSACVQADVAVQVSRRRQDLLARKLISSEDAERTRGDAESGRASCNAARASASAADAAVTLADAELRRAIAAQERSNIRAPVAGRVLDVHTRPGESIGQQGILELGRVDRMYAIAEVYETDIARVRVGQPATITSRAFVRPIGGVVERIRQQVRKQDQFGTDPAARKDARIVEVEIRLDDSSSVAALSNLQVEVTIGRRSAR